MSYTHVQYINLQEIVAWEKYCLIYSHVQIHHPTKDSSMGVAHKCILGLVITETQSYRIIDA